MNVIIVDYNSGNVSSVINSFKEVAKDKVNIEVTSDLNKIRSSDKVVLPGQGSFKSCVNALNKIDQFQGNLKYNIKMELLLNLHQYQIDQQKNRQQQLLAPLIKL